MQPRIIREWDAIPTALTELHSLLEYADSLATREQDRRGECRPQWIIVRENDAAILNTPWESEVEKNLHVEWLRGVFARDMSVKRFAFVCEIWQHRFDIKTQEVTTIDALLIQATERDGETVMRNYEVKSGTGRRKDRVLLEPEEEGAEKVGRLLSMFDPPATPSPR